MNLRQGSIQATSRDSSFSWSRVNERMPSASFSVGIASSFIIQRKVLGYCVQVAGIGYHLGHGFQLF